MNWDSDLLDFKQASVLEDNATFRFLDEDATLNLRGKGDTECTAGKTLAGEAEVMTHRSAAYRALTIASDIKGCSLTKKMAFMGVANKLSTGQDLEEKDLVRLRDANEEAAKEGLPSLLYFRLKTLLGE